MTRNKLQRILRSLRHGLTAILGERLEAVYLYGSQARGEARPDSDIGVLIVLREEFDYFNLLGETSQLIADLSLENDPDIASSHAYYAMFYIAEALLMSRNLAFSSHSAVIAAYGKEFARNKELDPKFHLGRRDFYRRDLFVF